MRIVEPERELLSRCARHNLRLTRPRRAILRVLAEVEDHPDVTELHRRVTEIEPGIAIATVYRTVRILEDKGIIKRHTFGDGRARYEPAEGEHHDHLIDVETGEVTEFRSDEIERLQEVIARAHGYEIVSHRHEIYVRPLGRGKGGARASSGATERGARSGKPDAD